MSLTYTNTPLDWENDGTEPSTEQKNNGYTAGGKLPASHLNYLIKNKQLVETELQNKLSDLHTSVSNKVDKVSGKGLSTNDFTTAEKQKLAGISEGATTTPVEDVLTSTSTTNALSAKQGKVLNDTKLPIAGGTITGNLTINGTLTGTLTGNAATATKLATAKTINGVAFDGSNNITISDSTKLPIAGGTITGDLTVNGTLTNANLTSTLDSKVDKEDGKGLSTEDFTTAEKTKLAGISTGATTTPVEDVLTSTSTTNALSANQGKILNDTKLPIAGGTITGDLTVNGTLTNANLTATINSKVDKVSGKGLSTNDYTTAEKTKLAGISEGATKTIVENVLTSTNTGNALSAAQGKVLNDTKLPTAGGTITGNLTVNGTLTNANLTASLNAKVDKVSGKQLSTNDFTTAEKQKLAGISTGANNTTIENVLTSTNAGNALSAAQGKILNDTKLPTAGGTITGNLTVNGTLTNANLTTSLNAKVDKVSGKQLSTEDYTTAEKQKLAGIADGANNVIVENSLGSGDVSRALSANMGKELNYYKFHTNPNFQDNVNLNSFTTSGIYYVATFQGTPGNEYPIQSTNGACVLEVHYAFSNRIHQRLTVPSGCAHTHVFERWLMDGSWWTCWSQTSPSSIEMTGWFQHNVETTVRQIFNIKNIRCNICLNFGDYQDNQYLKLLMPYYIYASSHSGGRAFWTFTSTNVDGFEPNVLEGKNQEYLIDLYFTSTPYNHRHYKFKAFGVSASSYDGDRWYQVNGEMPSGRVW